jgi:hypothetical protein
MPIVYYPYTSGKPWELYLWTGEILSFATRSEAIAERNREARYCITQFKYSDLY